MKCQNYLLLAVIFHIIHQKVCLKWVKLSDKENKEITHICGRIKQDMMNPGQKFPWAVHITAFLEGTYDENGDLAINQCAGILLSNRHILSVAHCFFNYKTESTSGTPEYSNKIFTNLSITAPTVQLGWQVNQKPEFVTKRAKVGAWHRSFRTKGRKDIAVYYSYFNWALLQLEDDLSKANDTAKWWKNGRIVPLCVADPQTKPDPVELSVFGFGQHEQCYQGKPICIAESNNTIVKCIKPNHYSACINAAQNGNAAGISLTTPGPGWHWKMPKSGISALMAMTLYKDHSANIIYGTRLKKRAFSGWIKDWLNLDAVYDQAVPGSTVLPLQAITTVSQICTDELDRTPVTCHFEHNTYYSLTIAIGQIGGPVYNYLLALDTGLQATVVWTRYATKCYLINNSTSTTPLRQSELYDTRIGVLPNYKPNIIYQHRHDSFGYGGIVKGITPNRIKMDMGLFTRWNSTKRGKFGAQGILGLSLTHRSNPDSHFMTKFIQQKDPNVPPIVSVDIDHKNGIKGNAYIAIGTSGRQTTSNGLKIKVNDPGSGRTKKWKIPIDTIQISFPNKRPWIKNNLSGFFDSGAYSMVIPRRYFNEINQTIGIDNSNIYLQPYVFNCADIFKYLPAIKMVLRDNDGSKTTDVYVTNSMYTKLSQPGQCLLQLGVGNEKDFILGVPIFGQIYVEFNYETEEVSIEDKP